jgi:hypothetical protein
MLAMVGVSATVSSVPRSILVLILVLELGLLSSSLQGNFLKVDREGVSLGLEDTWIE